MRYNLKSHSNNRSNGVLGLWFKSLVELLFPSVCACCSKLLDDGEHTICLTCRYDMPITHFVERHNNPMVELMAGRVNFDKASSLMFFRKDNHYRKLIHRMKYGGRDDLGRVLGEIYGKMLLDSGLYDDIEVVVPVPLHWTKRMKRGYNQSYEFARGIAASLGVECEYRAVKRIRATKTQAKLKKSIDRIENVEGAFSVVRPDLLRGRCVMLVDDVVTTGNTLCACAEVLNRSLEHQKINFGTIAIVG